jgi:hypothetical protein
MIEGPQVTVFVAVVWQILFRAIQVPGLDLHGNSTFSAAKGSQGGLMKRYILASAIGARWRLPPVLLARRRLNWSHSASSPKLGLNANHHHHHADIITTATGITIIIPTTIGIISTITTIITIITGAIITTTDGIAAGWPRPPAVFSSWSTNALDYRFPINHVRVRSGSGRKHAPLGSPHSHLYRAERGRQQHLVCHAAGLVYRQ